jgi:hypothetical protein
LPVTEVRLGPINGGNLGTPGNPIFQDATKSTGFTRIDGVSEVSILQANPPAEQQLRDEGVWDSISQGNQNLWVITQRREIQWGQIGGIICPQNRDAIVDVQASINTIYACQLIVMIVSIIVFIFNIALSWKEYKDRTDDKPDNDDAAMKMRTRCGLTGESINLIPTVVALAVAYSKVSFFNSIKNSNCSDAETNQNIGDLAAAISKIGTLNILKFLVTFPYFLFRLYRFIKGDKDANANTNTAKPIDMAGIPTNA